jgi:hypothetical protein
MDKSTNANNIDNKNSNDLPDDDDDDDDNDDDDENNNVDCFP